MMTTYKYVVDELKSSGIKTKIPSIYTLEDMWAIDTYTIKEGIMVKKATETHPDANKRKLIIANKASFNGAFVDDGKISLTGNHKFYIVGDKLELLKKMLDFDIINIIGHYTKYGQDFLDNEAFKYIPDIRKLGITDITEDEFYKLIGLTRQEINQIKKITSKEDDVSSTVYEEEIIEIEVKPEKLLIVEEDEEEIIEIIEIEVKPKKVVKTRQMSF